MSGRVDLRDVCTVFVVWSGEPDFERCIEALDAQNSIFRTHVVDHVAPMDAAFQQMLDVCRTPLYIQVDADMVLDPGAVLTMARDLGTQPDDVALVCYPLLDRHLEQLILGVKCYRHDVLVRYPYRASYSCEVGQIAQMERDGFRWVSRWPATLENHDDGFEAFDAASVLGEHSPTWTPHSIFVRYKRLGQKERRFGYYWLRPVLRRFLQRIDPQRPTLDLYAYNGLVAGLTGSLDDEREADYRDMDPDFVKLEEMLWPATW